MIASVLLLAATAGAPLDEAYLHVEPPRYVETTG